MSITFAPTQPQQTPALTFCRTVNMGAVKLDEITYRADFLQILHGREVGVAYCATPGVVALVFEGNFLGFGYKVADSKALCTSPVASDSSALVDFASFVDFA